MAVWWCGEVVVWGSGRVVVLICGVGGVENWSIWGSGVVVAWISGISGEVPLWWRGKGRCDGVEKWRCVGAEKWRWEVSIWGSDSSSPLNPVNWPADCQHLASSHPDNWDGVDY